EALAGPQPVEDLVRAVVEAVADTEVVLPTTPLGGIAESRRAPDAVHVPRDRLRRRQVRIVRRVGERRRRAVVGAEQKPRRETDDVALAQMARVLRVLEGAALDVDDDRIERRQRAGAER